MLRNNRIAECFGGREKTRSCVLVSYITAGDPNRDATLRLMRALVEGGTDIIELGVPFSDPMADGPVIQRASERALDNGMSLRGVFEIVEEFRRTNRDTPIVLMGYLNPIEAMGYAEFAQTAAAHGVDGVLTVDLPPEESASFNDELSTNHLDQIFLVAPNSSAARIDGVCRHAGGFVYYVSVKGVTGGKSIDAAEVTSRIAEFKQQLALPVGVGFGIKSATDAAAVANAGDAVIVGSAIIEIIERCGDDTALACRDVAEFVAQLRDAIDHVRSR